MVTIIIHYRHIHQHSSVNLICSLSKIDVAIRSVLTDTFCSPTQKPQNNFLCPSRKSKTAGKTQSRMQKRKQKLASRHRSARIC